MHRAFVVSVVLLLTCVAGFADAVEDVRHAEESFAKAFTDQNSAKFFSFVADDATFFGGGRTLNGKAAIVAAWSQYFKGAAPFSWTPERAAVDASGTLGMTTGPVYDAKSNHFADFTSVWQKQADGSWKIIFDGPGAQVCPPKK